MTAGACFMAEWTLPTTTSKPARRSAGRSRSPSGRMSVSMPLSTGIATSPDAFSASISSHCARTRAGSSPCAYDAAMEWSQTANQANPSWAARSAISRTENAPSLHVVWACSTPRTSRATRRSAGGGAGSASSRSSGGTGGSPAAA